MNGHAIAALEGKEGAERARADFANSINVNPFGSYEKDGWRRHAWDHQMKRLTNRRDCLAAEHNRARCCWEHDWHLLPWNRSQWGITSCRFCEKEADAERLVRAADAEKDGA